MEEVTHNWLSRLPPHVTTRAPASGASRKCYMLPTGRHHRERAHRRVPASNRAPTGTSARTRNINNRDPPRSSSITTTSTYNRSSSNPELMIATHSCWKRSSRRSKQDQRPKDWPTPTVAPKGYDLQLLPLPYRQPNVAMAFSIRQTGSDGRDKIRCGEDWRRSGHNSTCTMRDQPFHHKPDHFASLVIQTHQLHPDEDMHVWGHDHDGAHHQLPLDNPESAYVLLRTPQGPTLWSHNILLFGSSASVWGYNRFGDAMVSVSRVLLLCPTMRYVDDYGSTEITRHSASGFQAFEDFNGALDYRMKPSKRQSPAQSRKIQGVRVSIEQHHVVLTPCPQRIHRMRQEILSCIRLRHGQEDGGQVQLPHGQIVRQGRASTAESHLCEGTRLRDFARQAHQSGAV